MEEEWTLARIDSLDCSFVSLVERGRSRATTRTLEEEEDASLVVLFVVLLLPLGAVLAR